MEFPFLLVFGAILVALFAAGILSSYIKVPAIILFITVGFFLQALIEEVAVIEALGKIGLVLLFFFIGLEFSPDKLRYILSRIWIAGLLDLFLGFAIVLPLMMLLGLDFLNSLFLAGIVYASSTALVMKLLVDNRRLASPEAEYILGLLIFEDLVYVLLVALYQPLSHGGALSLSGVLGNFAGAVAFFGLAGGLAFIFRRRLAAFLERFEEHESMIFLTLGGILLVSGIFLFFGFSELLGAFLLGTALSESGKGDLFSARLLPIREISVGLFFLSFGFQLPFQSLDIPLVPVGVLAAVGLLGKPLAVFLGGLGYGLSPRASLRAGFSMVPRGEFSIVVAALAPPGVRLIGTVYLLFCMAMGIPLFLKAETLAQKVFPPLKPAPEAEPS